MITKLIQGFLDLPKWGRYVLVALTLPVTLPLFLVGGLIVSTCELIEIYIKDIK